MNLGTLLSERLHFVTALTPDADRFNGDPTTDWINLANYGACTFVLMIGAGATGTALITAEFASSAAGAGNTATAFNYRRVSATGTSDLPGDITAATTSGFTTTAGANQNYFIEIPVAELDPDLPFVSLTLTEVVNDPVDAGVIAILGDPRYGGNTHQTAIA